MSKIQYLTNVATLKLSNELCTGCGMCITVCPHHVFEIRNKKAHIIDIDDCMECGACSLNCKFGALTVRSGVGCAAGIINGIHNNAEPSCGCSQPAQSACC